ncbi:cytochrome-c peroxidase [Methyloferula stellata]|uniref:cytochrome-c peroxidase n=1 Tax=Methyloferula stellata TaxID=876270 RepID=UPI0003A1C654|nr:cytochrome c peroxidase [Methyloferula stellata]
MKRSSDLMPAFSRTWFARLPVLLSVVLAMPFAAADPVPPASQTISRGSNTPVELSAVAQLGRKMFFDPSLSRSGQLACASCHSPEHAYGPPNDLAVQLGGPDMKRAGLRAVPSLRYLEHTPNFSIGPGTEFADIDPPASEDAPAAVAVPAGDIKVASVAKADTNNAALADAEANVPQGGLDWDGRANTLQEQALGPLLDPNEMDNHSAGDFLERVKRAPYAEDIRKLFGANIFDQPSLAVDEALFALVRFQSEDPSFHPYDSKYDAFLAGKAVLSDAEARGLKLFEDPKKGNCSSCHIDKPSRDGLFRPAFTDYQFEAFGAPRNRDIPANRDPHYYDLGLCGPMRKDYTDAAPYCGLFKTPTLRNAAIRKVFFHNGVFHSLDDVMHFYVERETNAAKWYPKLPNGEIDAYDDLPPEYKRNVDVADAPFDRKQGNEPALNNAEIADVIAFLNTLTDGYQIDQFQAKTAPATAR